MKKEVMSTGRPFIRSGCARDPVEADMDLVRLRYTEPAKHLPQVVVRREMVDAFEIDADASKEEIAALVAQSQKRSAVFDIVTNPTNVAVEIR